MWQYNKNNANSILKGNKNAILTITISVSILIALIIGFALWAGLSSRYNLILPIVLSTGGIFIGSIIVCNYATRKIRSDIKTGKTIAKNVVAKSVVMNKEDVEAGSGALYIPILGDLFPKLFGQKMNRTFISYIIDSENNEKYYIPNDVHYDSASKFIIYFGEQSGVYLGCQIQ